MLSATLCCHRSRSAGSRAINTLLWKLCECALKLKLHRTDRITPPRQTQLVHMSERQVDPLSTGLPSSSRQEMSSLVKSRKKVDRWDLEATSVQHQVSVRNVWEKGRYASQKDDKHRSICHECLQRDMVSKLPVTARTRDAAITDVDMTRYADKKHAAHRTLNGWTPRFARWLITLDSRYVVDFAHNPSDKQLKFEGF